MRRVMLAALFIAAYAVFLAALAPAAFVAERVQRFTRGGLQLQGAEGTIWSGRGRATLATPAGPLALDELRWRFLPARMLSGELAFALEGRSAGFTARGVVGRSPRSWEARNVEASGEASGAAAFLPLIAHWRPEGTLALSAPAVRWSDAGVQGEARIEWRSASLALAQLRPLGSYRAELRGEGGPARIALSTLEGPLRLAGQGTYTPPSRLALSGEARAEPAAAAALEGLLDLIGPRRADGSRAIDWRVN